MKIIMNRCSARWVAMVGSALLIGFMLCQGIACWRSHREESVLAEIEQKTEPEIKNEQLLSAFNRLGSCDATGAVKLWADGVKQRNAAMQYAALSAVLRERYAKDLETTAPNWVTGVSSPWVDDYRVDWLESAGSEKRSQIHFFFVTSDGPAQEMKAELSLDQRGDNWYITSLNLEEELVPYTGFTERTGGNIKE